MKWNTVAACGKAKANGRIRTNNRWLTELLLKNAKAIVAEQLMNQEQIDFARYLASLMQESPELCQVIETWPELLFDTRKQIIKIIEADNC